MQLAQVLVGPVAAGLRLDEDPVPNSNNNNNNNNST